MSLEGVKIWLMACGSTFGANDVYHYRKADRSTSFENPYFEYTIERIEPHGPVCRGGKRNDLPGEPTSTVATITQQEFIAELQIDLHNMEDGIAHLAACSIAAEKEQAIKSIFQGHNIGWLGMVSATNLSRFDDERIWYHHRMIVNLRTSIIHEHTNYNHIINTVTHSVDIGD